MPEAIPREQLLRSLGLLVRGLSSLFWGLPVTLILCFHTARAESLKTLGVLPPLLSTAWLAYALWQIGAFHPQEHVWRNAVDRARVLSLILCGLSPFLFWSRRLPESIFFTFMVMLLGFFSLLFMGTLNHMLRRLGAMLPDETLRLEIRQFTALNLGLLTGMFVVMAISVLFLRIPVHQLPDSLQLFRTILDRFGLLLGIPLFLLPLAMTMAMLWKTKEVILDSLFSGKH